MTIAIPLPNQPDSHPDLLVLGDHAWAGFFGGSLESLGTGASEGVIDLEAELRRRRGERLGAAIDGVRAEAAELLGILEERRRVRRDPETGEERVVLALTVGARSQEELLAGEERLHLYLVEKFPDIEEELVLLCRRA